MEEEQGMLKSSCWIAACTMQEPLTKEMHESLDSMRRIHLSVPGELQPCLFCPNEVWLWCIENHNECEEFAAFADYQAYGEAFEQPHPKPIYLTNWGMIKMAIKNMCRGLYYRLFGSNQRGEK